MVVPAHLTSRNIEGRALVAGHRGQGRREQCSLDVTGQAKILAERLELGLLVQQPGAVANLRGEGAHEPEQSPVRLQKFAPVPFVDGHLVAGDLSACAERTDDHVPYIRRPGPVVLIRRSADPT